MVNLGSAYNEYDRLLTDLLQLFDLVCEKTNNLGSDLV